jgi:ABC-type uncharacterized transport system auxiliary subunit
VLAGCVRLGGPAPQIREYQLRYPGPTTSEATLPAIVEIGPIGVAAVYDRDSMVYRDDTHTTGTYADSRWSANPGQMVIDLLVRDASATGSYRAVQRAPSLLPVDYRLSGEVSEIDEHAAGSCSAHLELRLVLVRARGGSGRAVLWQRGYAGEEPCACNQPSRLAAAMSQALATISARVRRDLYDTIASDTTAPAPAPRPTALP